MRCGSVQLGRSERLRPCLLRKLLRLHSSRRLKCRRLLGIQGSCQGTCTFPKTFSAFCCLRLMASQILIPILQQSDRASTRSSFKVDREVIVYDYVKRKLTKEPKEKIEGMMAVRGSRKTKYVDVRAEIECLEVDLPGSKTRCDIYIQAKSSDVKTYFATVDLSHIS